MKIVGGGRSTANTRIERYKKEMADFIKCPNCRSIVSRARDVKVFTEYGTEISPYNVEAAIREDADGMMIVAQCPRCKCEWYSEYF